MYTLNFANITKLIISLLEHCKCELHSIKDLQGYIINFKGHAYCVHYIISRYTVITHINN